MTQDYFVTSSEERLNNFYCFKLGDFTVCFAMDCISHGEEVTFDNEEEANCGYGTPLICFAARTTYHVSYCHVAQPS